MPRALILVAVVACTAAAQPPASQPATRPFVVAKDTTVALGPVRPDGTIDYVAALNERYGANVKLDDNAAVALLEVLGRSPARDRAALAKAGEMLGLPAAVERRAGTFRSFAAYAEENPDAAGGDVDPDEEMNAARDRVSWKAADAPRLAAWLTSVDAPLDQLVAASSRPRFYFPIVPVGDRPTVMSAAHPHWTSLRDVMNALALRATRRLGAGDVDGFRKDAIAIVRFGSLSSQTPTLIGKLVAMGVGAMGLDLVKRAAAAGEFSAEQCDAILADLRAVPAPAPLAECFDLAERAMTLEFLQLTATYGPATAGRMMGRGDAAGGAALPKLGAIDTSAHDWNAGLRQVNGWYDRLAAAGRAATHAERLRRIEAVELDARKLAARTNGVGALLASIEDRILAVTLPSFGRAYAQEVRRAADADLAQFALALRADRLRAGAYPAALADLAPRYFKTIPTDPFTGRPFVYRRDGQGYVLYSVGPNGKDDWGDATRRNDDMVVRAER